MRQILSLAFLFLLVAACDTAEAPSPLAGTWVATASQTETLVTSTVDQSVPDLSVQGAGGITVSGRVDDTLDFVSFLVRIGETETVEFSSVRNPLAESGTVSVLRVVQNEGRLDRMFLDRQGDTPDGYLVQGTASDPLVLTYQEGRFRVVPTVLSAIDGSGAEVTVGGTVTFPLLSLSAGTESVVRVESGEADDYSVTFDEDGAFQVTAGGELFPASGRWRTDGDELVLSGLGQVARVPYSLAGTQLQISASTLDVCDDFCRADLEGALYAEPGSFEGIRTILTDTFRRATD